jgi:hypothetical protein
MRHILCLRGPNPAVRGAAGFHSTDMFRVILKFSILASALAVAQHVFAPAAWAQG